MLIAAYMYMKVFLIKVIPDLASCERILSYQDDVVTLICLIIAWSRHVPSSCQDILSFWDDPSPLYFSFCPKAENMVAA